MYAFNLTDSEWAVLAPLLPDPGYGKPKNGQSREWTYREILNAIFYITKLCTRHFS